MKNGIVLMPCVAYAVPEAINEPIEPDSVINPRGAKKRLHAEGARLVRNDRNNELADLRVLEHFAKHAHKRHRRGNFPALAAFEKFLEKFVVIRYQRFRANAALGDVAAERFTPRAKILNLN